MAELYEEWLVSPMTRAEVKELSDEEKKERKRLQKRNSDRKYREENKEKNKERHRKYNEENKEKEKERSRKYREENKEKEKERHRLYHQTPAGKKVYMLAKWKSRGLQESDEELDIIYELYLHQEFCYSCDVRLTRDGVCSTQAVLDHDHITHRFRQICCRSCNTMDSWMQYWC